MQQQKSRYWLLGMIAFITNPVALERVMFPLEMKQIKNKIGTRCSEIKHAVILTVTLILDFLSTSSRLRPSVRTWTPFLELCTSLHQISRSALACHVRWYCSIQEGKLSSPLPLTFLLTGWLTNRQTGLLTDWMTCKCHPHSFITVAANYRQCL